MKKNFTILIITFCLLSNFAFSQDFWKEVSLPENEITSLNINIDGVIFVGTQKGLYKSGDFIDEWFIIPEVDTSVIDIYIDKNNNLYILTSISLLYSTDGANSFTQIPKENEVDGRCVFANNDAVFIYGWTGIFKTSDNGLTWVKTLDIGNNVSEISKIDISQEGTLFAGVFGYVGISGLYYSNDNGDTWKSTGLYGGTYQGVKDLAFNSKGGLYIVDENGIGYSDDLGDNWTFVPFIGSLATLMIDKYDAVYVCSNMIYGILPRYAGVYKTNDNGSNWTRLVSGMSSAPSVLKVIESSDGYLFAFDTYLDYDVLYKSFEKVQPVSIKEDKYNNNNKLTLSPNPIKNNLNLKIDNVNNNFSNANIKFFNINGTLVFDQNIETFDGTINIDFKYIEPGIYIIHILNDKLKISSKFVKI